MAEPKLNVLTHSFNNGEVSRAALNRIDKETLRLYAEYQENLIPAVIGKATMRPGLQYLLATAGNDRPETIPFESSDAAVEDALLVLTDAVLRVVINDAYVTRPSVTSSVTNGDFSSSTGWTVTVSSGAVGNINSTVSGSLYMGAPARGSSVSCTRSVTTSSAGTLHALRIEVTRGPVMFRCGETSGSDEYISETMLETGTHSLAFTPTGTYHVFFKTEREPGVIVNSIQVESAGVMELTTPWLEADLRGLRWAQSEDVLFVASSPYQQRRIERRGDGENSWSLVLYKTGDGPFTTARTAETRLKPTATHGNTTLTAEDDFFTPEHVGAIFRLDHENFAAEFILAGSGQYTDTWRITGIAHADTNDRDFSYVTTGTWVGTITMERSIDNEFEGFHDASYDNGSTDTDFTTNQTVTHNGAAEENNAIYFNRLGFKEGEYTSGSITINVTYDGHFGYGFCRVTAYTSPTEVSIEVLRDFKNTIFTANWREGEWSDRRGWPSAVEFHDGRLFWGRNGNYWGSESDNYSSFDSETEGDSRTIGRSITVGASAEIRWMLSLQRLMMGLRSAEVSARSSSFDEPLTATNITLKAASTQGVADVPPVKIDSRGIYLQRSGRKLYELAYDIEANDYQSVNIMRVNEDMALSDYIADGASDGSIIRIAAQRQPDTHIWSVREDGIAIPLLYEPSEKVRGFWRFITGNVSPGGNAPWDQIVSIAVLPSEGEDKIYMGVARTINGTTTYSIERLRAHSEAIQRSFDLENSEIVARNGLYMADSFVTATGNSTLAQVLTGFSHLIGREAIVVGQRVDTGVDDAFTKALLHFNGADGATSFKDESGKTWTAAGNAQIDTDYSQFTGSSGLFDGTGDYISTPDHADFTLGSSDFTIEARFRVGQTSGTARAIAGQSENTFLGGDSSWILRRDTSNVMAFYWEAAGATALLSGTTQFNHNTNTGFHHLAVTRSGNTFRLFVDGVLEDTATQSGAATASSQPVTIGARGTTDNWLGWIDEVRISVGIARWTEDFTPPTEPYGDPENNTYGPLLDTDGEVELITVDGSGQIALPADVAMSGTLCAGLPYRGRYKSSKLAYGAEGTPLLQKKIVKQFGLALLDTHPNAIRVGRNFTASEMDEMPRIRGDGTEREDDGFLEREVDESTFSFPGVWDTDSRVCIEVRPGFSATLSALVTGMETNEK